VKTLSRKPVVRIALVLSVLTLAGVVALASAGHHHGILTSPDGRFAIATQGSGHFTPAAEPDSTLTVVAGNLSKYPLGVYFCCYGATISGPQSFLGSENWAAVPFTPTANYTVKELRASVGWGQNGTNGVTLGLYSDASGLPGTVLFARNVTNLGTFGLCCTLAEAKDSTGVAITSGTQYWVVASTSSSTTTTFDAWAFNSTEQTYSTYAFFNTSNNAWLTTSFVLPGFEVLGQ